jgi:hypothetical protein
MKLWRFLAIVAFASSTTLFSTTLFAQNRVINGRVTDTTGNGLSGATVQVQGGRGGTQPPLMELQNFRSFQRKHFIDFVDWV